uniref:S8/S53 family peptidase n=1 Tax=uncultured Sphingomonas sp. TaxID=158754 RepID=UPI0035CC282A
SALILIAARFSSRSSRYTYDTDRVLAALSSAGVPASGLGEVVVGVADSGLAGAAGAPLPSDLFHRGMDKVDETPEDDDQNDYNDDLVGAGPSRPGAEVIAGLLGDGDLRLCPTPNPAYHLWSPASLAKASHGSMVASIAAGLALRPDGKPPSPWLPRIAFFRLMHMCEPGGEVEASPAAVVQGIQYLFRREATIVNLSYLEQSSTYGSQAAAIKEELAPWNNRYLVIAAGNKGSRLDHEDRSCLTCLANIDEVRRQVFVVGAADRDLRRLPTSNHGRGVTFYAPGVWQGSMPIAGQAPPDAVNPPSTSAAAPLVTLALRILRSTGEANPVKIRQRLIETSWPLEAPDEVGDEGAWVVDLTKVAAVRRDVVETIRSDPEDGVVRRRTFIGEIQNPKDLRLCETGSLDPINRLTTRAVRLTPTIDGRRRFVRFLTRTRNDGRAFLRERDVDCIAGSGTVRIRDDVSGREEIIPAAEVMAIIFPMS